MQWILFRKKWIHKTSEITEAMNEEGMEWLLHWCTFINNFDEYLNFFKNELASATNCNG